METPTPEKLFRDSIYMYLMLSGKEIKNDGIADFVIESESEATAYFLSRDAEKAVITKAAENARNYKNVYLVFGNEKEYIKLRNEIPQDFGIILHGNLYGMGNITLTVRKPNEKRSFKSVIHKKAKQEGKGKCTKTVH